MFNYMPFYRSPKYSSRPSYITAPNGMNFSRSVTNPNSRLSRVRDYLHLKGEATKAEIFRDVFGKDIKVVSTGWGCYLFSLGVRQGFFKKVRRGNQVFWSNT